MNEFAALFSAIWSLLPAYLAWWGAFVDPGDDDPEHDRETYFPDGFDYGRGYPEG